MNQPIAPTHLNQAPFYPFQSDHNPLNYDGAYACPVCRYGEISAFSLMDAFGCHFCQHIFTADLKQQCITMVDGSQPLTWYWNGRTWQGKFGAEIELGWGIWVGAVFLVLLPPIFIWLGSHIFPPLPGSRLAWFPDFWTVCAFVGHLTCVLWLWVKAYQFPVRAFFRAWGRYLQQRGFLRTIGAR